MALFDELSKKVGSLTQTTIQKSKELAEIAKLNIMISTEEDNIKKTYTEIGRLYFEENGASATGKYGELCGIVATAMSNIQDLRDKLNEIKNINLCPACGAEVAATSKFCNKCGGAMATASSKPVCKECNAELEEGSGFCTGCGVKVE